jgi:hypothetical protein
MDLDALLWQTFDARREARAIAWEVFGQSSTIHVDVRSLLSVAVGTVIFFSVSCAFKTPYWLIGRAGVTALEFLLSSFFFNIAHYTCLLCDYVTDVMMIRSLSQTATHT